MAKHKIYIKVKPNHPDKLQLSNRGKKGPYTHGNPVGDKHFTTDVKTGDKVKWKIGDESITSINAILPVNKDDLFRKDPTCKNNWEGKIGNGKGEEIYTITYRVGNQLFTCDPKISMGSK